MRPPGKYYDEHGNLVLVVYDVDNDDEPPASMMREN